MKKSKVIGRHTTKVSPIIFGIVISLISLFASSLVVSLVVSAMKNPVEVLSLGSLVAFMLSGAISGFVIAKKNKGMGFRASLFSSLFFIVAVFLVSLVLKKGSVSGSSLMNYLCYIMISAFFSFWGSREPHRRRRR